MELRHLQTFAAAAEQESFTAAARAMNMTQAAVSQQVASLEKELNDKLFERKGRGVRLTERGQRLYGYARRILELVDEATSSTGDSATSVSGNLRIASSTVPSEWLLPELLAEFHGRYPRIRESLTVSDSSLATVAVEAGEADVGFVGEAPRTSSLTAVALAEDELALFVAADHPLAAKRTTTLKQLRAEPLIVREPGSGSRRCFERELENHNVSPAELNIAMEANSNDAIRSAVARGVGAAFLSERAHRDASGLGRLKVRGFRPRRRLFVIHHRDRIQPPPTRAFLEFIHEWQTRQE